ncbi:MAG: aminopeptidase [Clostridiales bacterium]|jgi:aminopeptidase|nr:aminopeptidase [Clostridiales bacterium]
MDQRNKTLAENLVKFSTKIQPGERALIEAHGTAGVPLAAQLVKAVYAAGGVPFVNLTHEVLTRELLLRMPEEAARFTAERDMERMRGMSAYIAIRSYQNALELSDAPQDRRDMYNRVYRPVTEYRVGNTKWVVLTYPSPSCAQDAALSTEAYEDFYYDVCCLDYSKMGRAMEPLKALMERTDEVRVKGPGTDLAFSIKGIPVIPCAGENNIPDGEIYTAPVKNSVNGTIAYNTPSVHQGFCFENVRLTFRDGKITEASANDTERVNKIFDTDEGARYIGEFALGVNPYIVNPAKNTLFDEKISGSFHFTPGASYDEAFNGNKSAVHWDLVCIQTPERGGGEIYFDGVLIRKDGRFTLPELAPLNPENLK